MKIGENWKSGIDELMRLRGAAKKGIEPVFWS
jgi:hypothetical protein